MRNFSTTKAGWVSFEDSTCEVVCECGYGLDEAGLSVSDYTITRCPRCGRGYKSEFVVWQYAQNEGDNQPLTDWELNGDDLG